MLFVPGAGDALVNLLQLAFKAGERVVEGLGRGLVAPQLVALTCDAQVQGSFQHLGDATQGVAPLGHATDALPAGQGNAQGEQQHQAEADAEFTIDAHVTQVLG
ncbi:hypothetical protein D3C80_1890600 [compost metagenome]